MKKRILLVVLSVLCISSAIVSADSKPVKKQNKYQINNAIVAYNNLSMEIDYWHDATLKANKSAVAEHKRIIHEIISQNIKENHQFISYAKLDASYTKETMHTKSDDKTALSKDESVFRAKKLIFDSLKKSQSFAYSYRLLADYLQILKDEIDAHKIEVADASVQKEK